jgi:acetyltransferase-like isoleucine patch superfamily enzyme
MGAGVELDVGCTVAAYGSGRLELRSGVFLGHHCTVAARDSIVIDEGTFLAELVSVRDHDHDPTVRPSSGRTISAPVFIGGDVWLGAKVTVLRGVSIGNGAVVGANAVVTKNVPASSLAVGVPARIRRIDLP